MSSVYLVMREDPERAAAAPQLAFTDRGLAEEHAAQAAAASGAAHTVLALPLAQEVPLAVRWHVMAVELDLTGVELWRHEEDLVSFAGHRDAVAEATVTWRVVVRDTPSQPPSRVRMEIVGPDRAWCIEAARRGWSQAQSSDPFAEAVAIEALFAVNSRR